MKISGLKNVEKVGKVLVSPPKLGIVVTLGKNESESFTTIKKKLRITGGTLNYHLLFLQKEGLVEKTDNGEYMLSDEGKQVFQIVKSVVSKE